MSEKIRNLRNLEGLTGICPNNLRKFQFLTKFLYIKKFFLNFDRNFDWLVPKIPNSLVQICENSKRKETKNNCTIDLLWLFHVRVIIGTLVCGDCKVVRKNSRIGPGTF